MKFCTTCGRTYEDPDIAMCPQDGTPLFGMAGSEGQDLPDEDVDVDEEQAQTAAAELAADMPGLSTEPVAPSSDLDEQDDDEQEEDIPLPGSTLPAEEEEDDDIPLPGSTLSSDEGSSDEEGFDEDLFIPPSDPVDDEDPFMADSEEEEVIAAQVGTTDALSESERLLFGDDENESLLSDDSEATPDGAPVLGDALFDDAPRQDFDIEVPGADDAASIQISEALDTTLGEESSQSEPEAAASLANVYEPTSIPGEEELRPSAGRMADPLSEESEKGKGGLVLGIIFLLLVAAGLAWYFLAGPGAQKPADPTPDVTQQKDVTPAETPKVEQPAVVPDAGAPAGATPDAGTPAAADMASSDMAPAADMGGEAQPATLGQTPPPVEEEPKVPAKKPVRKPVSKPAVKKTPPKVEEAPKEEPPPEKKELDNELNNLLD